MRLTRRQIGIGLGALAASPAIASAHREAASHTKIIWDDRNKLLSITHSFHMHDAATALAQAGIIDTPDLLSLKARAKLALYAEENFKLQDLQKTDLPLTLIGADFDSRNVYVFQQIQMDNAPLGLTISCSLFHGLIPGQVNDIDINLGQSVRSVRFKSGDLAKIILA